MNRQKYKPYVSEASCKVMFHLNISIRYMRVPGFLISTSLCPIHDIIWVCYTVFLYECVRLRVLGSGLLEGGGAFGAVPLEIWM